MSHSDAPDKTHRFNLDLKGACPNGNGGRIQVAKWTEGYVIQLDSGHPWPGVVTDRESMIQLRDKLSKLLDDTQPEGEDHVGS